MRRKHIYFPNNCFYCGIEIRNKWEHSYDHIVPLSKGGKDRFENLVDCCKNCNQSKAALSLEEWRLEIKKKVEQLEKEGANHPGFIRYSQLLEKVNEILNL